MKKINPSTNFKNPVISMIYLVSIAMVFVYTFFLASSQLLDRSKLLDFIFVGVSGGTLCGITFFILFGIYKRTDHFRKRYVEYKSK